jgi:hypothetical protein
VPIVHGQLRTQGSANETAGQVSVVPTIEGTVIDRQLITISASFPTLSGSDFSISSGSQTISPGAIVNIFVNGGTLTIDPGSYGDLTVNAGNVILSAGTYTFTNVTFNPSATFSPNISASVLRINVRGTLIFRAACSNFSVPNLRWAVFGTGGATIGPRSNPDSNVFRGTVVAMNGPLIIEDGSRSYRGAFFGLSVTVHGGATIQHLAFSAWEAGV